jgi:hypothetical protein
VNVVRVDLVLVDDVFLRAGRELPESTEVRAVCCQLSICVNDQVNNRVTRNTYLERPVLFLLSGKAICDARNFANNSLNACALDNANEQQFRKA